MTVMVTALENEEELQKAQDAMATLPAMLHQHDDLQLPLCVHLEGLSHFRHEVRSLEPL